MKTIKIKLSEELLEKINKGTAKATEMVDFILHNIEGSKTEKDIDKTSLLDIEYPNKKKLKGVFVKEDKLCLMF